MDRRALITAPLAAATAAAAGAHPVDEVVQSAYLLIAPDRLRLELDITPGPIVSPTVLRTLDPNDDGILSPAEKRAYGRRVLDGLTLRIDGRPVAWRFDQIGVPSYNMLRRRAGTVQLFAVARVAIGHGPRQLTFHNAYRPARGPVTANVFAAPATAFGFADQRRSNDGRAFAVTVRAR